MVRAQHAVTHKLTSEQLIESARSSTDGLYIREAINRIEESAISQEVKDATMSMLADTHGDKPIVVTRCLSSLGRSQAPQLRTICRRLINAPFNPDAEDVVAYAATLLAPLPDPERVDMLLLAKAVDHRSMAIRNTARLAIEQLPKERAEALLNLAKAEQEKPPISLLKRYLTGVDWRTALIPPRRPEEAHGEPAASTPTQDAHILRTSSGDTRSRPHFKKRRERPSQEASAQTHDTEATRLANDGTAAAQLNKPGSLPSISRQREHAITLQAHRLPEFALCTDSLLANEIVMSKDYRRIAAALAEYTIRHGAKVALQFNGRLLYALTDPNNLERVRFDDIARCWFPEDPTQNP